MLLFHPSCEIFRENRYKPLIKQVLKIIHSPAAVNQFHKMNPGMNPKTAKRPFARTFIRFYGGVQNKFCILP
jgi:hypothetical protein